MRFRRAGQGRAAKSERSAWQRTFSAFADLTEIGITYTITECSRHSHAHVAAKTLSRSVLTSVCVLQITMTTGWLLLLLVVSSQSVDSQSTTDDEVCGGEQLCDVKRDIQMLMDNQRHLLQQYRAIMNRLGRSFGHYTAYTIHTLHTSILFLGP